MEQRRDLTYEESDQAPDHSENLKLSALSQLIPADYAFYDFDHVALIPRTHFSRRTIDGDAIPLKTSFDDQAAIGHFSLDTTEDIQGFSRSVTQLCETRDRYIKLSGQSPVDNPINWDTWISYPPPQPKGWHYEEEYGRMDYYYDETAHPHYFGENFNIEDYRKNVLELCLKEQDNWKAQRVEVPEVPTLQQFCDDLGCIIDLSKDRRGQMLSLRRLDFLRSKFEEYSLLNEHRETYITKLNPHRDFYNSRKIDNNVDAAMCMTRKHLLNVINLKLKEEPQRVVYEENGVKMTLEELFEPYFSSKRDVRLNIDDLFEFGIVDRLDDGMLFDASTRYDSIIKDEVLNKIDKTFLRMENAISGEYLSLVLKQVLSDFEKSKYQFAELGLNLSFMDSSRDTRSRWSSTASWIVGNKLVSHNVKWIIRLPRNYGQLRRSGRVNSFREYLDLLFKPLFDVTNDPMGDIDLHFFLTKVSALSLLPGRYGDDHSILDLPELLSPEEWSSKHNPPYSYYLYHIYAEVSRLNALRKSRKFQTLSLRPFLDSNTSYVEPLASSYLLATDIIHGEQLANHSVMQYLYYLSQIGIVMAPLCWNKTIQLRNDDERYTSENGGATYETNPAIDFFKIGMRVALSTNKPLFSALTREPLIEEYSVAGSIHKLSGVDLCELCRNSVLISGFNGHLKKHWIGVKYTENGIEDVDEFAVQRTNVPNMRLDYRRDCVTMEREFIKRNL